MSRSGNQRVRRRHRLGDHQAGPGLVPAHRRLPREVRRGRPLPGRLLQARRPPSEKEILTSRLCDRPCRPLFPEGFLNEVQIIGILLTADQKNESDIAMVNGASAALAISDIPWNGPIAAVRVGLVDGQFVANPTIEQMFSSSLDLIYVGNEKDMLMIEGSADQLPEDRFIEALAFAHQAVQPVIKAIKKLVALAGKPKSVFRWSAPRPRPAQSSSGSPAPESPMPSSQGKGAALGERQADQGRGQRRPSPPNWAKASSPTST